MKFIKTENNCNGCPYLQTPAVDLHEIEQYYTCKITYKNTYDLEHLKEICPFKTIMQVLKDFICYNAAMKGNVEINTKKEMQIIRSFIEEKL